MMKILQLIYTSCQKGLSPGAGFQTFAMSDGISQEEKREIERFGLYVPLTDLPTQPSDAEINAKFPVAFRFFRLESGRYAINQARYIGQDYSGRYGNYFSHTLVLESGTFPAYPIQWYNSSLFRSTLTLEEANVQTTPPPLPTLELADLEAGKTLRLEDITTFIEEQGMDTLKQMLSAAMSFDKEHRRLVISDTRENTATWIAAIQMAFPLELAHLCTFSTYTHDPAAMNIMISGVPRTGSRFAFSDMQRNFEYYIFDFNSSPNNTAIDVGDHGYIKTVEIGYSFSPENLLSYHVFVSRFQPPGISTELDHIDTLYHMSETGIEGFPSDRVLDALEFANREASPEILEQLADSMGQVVTGLSQHADFKTAGTVARFLFKVARQSGDNQHLETAYTFFFQVLDHLIHSDPQPDLHAALTLYDGVMTENKKHMGEFAAKALDPSRIQQVRTALSKNPFPGSIEIYFHLMVKTLFAIDYSWDRISRERQGFQPYVEFSMAIIADHSERLCRVMETVAQKKDFFVRLLAFCLRRGLVTETLHPTFLDGFVTTLKTKPSDIPAYVRMKLVKDGHQDFVYQEYLALLKMSQNRREFFVRYTETVFLKDPRFLKSHFSKAVYDFLDYLPGQEMFSACSGIIAYGDVIDDAAVLTRVIKGFEKGLSLCEPKKGELPKIQRCGFLKKQCNIITTPDITRLILLAEETMKVYASRGQSPLKIADLVESGAPQYSLQDLDFNRIKNYFTWIFPYLVSLVRTAKDHGILFKWFDNSGLDRSWVQAYPNEIRQIIREDKVRGLEILREFLKFYLKLLYKQSGYFSARKIVREKLVKIMCKLPQSQFDALLRAVYKSTAIEAPADKREWTAMLEEVDEKKQKSGFSILKRLFGRKKITAHGGKKSKDAKKTGLQKI